MHFPRRLGGAACATFAAWTLLAAAEPAPVQGAALLKTDILGVFAHPDDETGAAATLAAYAKSRGLTVVNVYCTRGEGGGNMVGTQSGAALGILREAELRDCLDTLGVKRCFFLDREDFAYTESLSVTLEKWGHVATVERLVRLVRALRPEVIVTMNPAPRPGQHGNHQAAGLLALEAFDLAADPRNFADQLAKEGLGVWRPRKLYYGGPPGTGAAIDVDTKLPGGGTPAELAGAAAAHHRSQGFGNFSRPRSHPQPQHWTLVESVIPFAGDETDFFRGLPVTGDTPERLFAPGDAPAAAPLGLRFRGRPAFENYHYIVQALKIGHVAATLPIDVPVVAGEETEVSFWVMNSTPKAEPAVLRYQVTDGWRVAHDEVHALFSANRTNRASVLVQAPAGRLDDAELKAVAEAGGMSLPAAVRLHPVPRLSAAAMATPPPIDPTDEDPAWAALEPHFISHTNHWEGSPADDRDCSAVFRIGRDQTNLYVEVRVRDDHVISNIEPDDIKGHWRSDSVELCFDPAAGAEHTLDCFKIGIFPFDAKGRVRAARDADRKPGPVEETSPGTRLASWRTRDGYAIRASVPFADVGVEGAPKTRLGFNVLIYDGDKVDAKPGENINKARLAWSPRPGVQGRPEDWGRLDLK